VPRTARCDANDQRDREQSAEPMLANDPNEQIEQALPTEPIESTEPTEPIDRIEPFEPMDRIECSERIDHLEVCPAMDRNDTRPICPCLTVTGDRGAR
jgi:hypothetical protein